MNKVFFETTALADAFFKGANARNSIQAKTPEAAARITSQYAVYELSRGFLRNLILLYNKSQALTRFSELIKYTHAIQRKSHMLGTILEAFEVYYAEARTKLENPSDMSSDEYELVHFRAYLGPKIRRSWRKMEAEVQVFSNNVGCRTSIPPPVINKDTRLYEQELRQKLCGKASACGLRQYMWKNKEDFVQLREKLREIPNKDSETEKRIRSLKELYRKDKGDFQRDHCWRCGDALIVHEVDPRVPIVTTNLKHIAPIAANLNKIIVG